MSVAKKQQTRVDRRVARTRVALHEALVGLILEKGWDDVTILDVCERADVGRSTFYTHFADREDLLLAGFEHLKIELRAARKQSTGRLRFARALIVHAGENRRLFRALVGKRTGQVVVRLFRAVVLEMTLEELPARLTGVERTTTALYLAGGLYELLAWWLDGRTTLDAEDLEAAVQKLAGRVLG